MKPRHPRRCFVLLTVFATATACSTERPSDASSLTSGLWHGTSAKPGELTEVVHDGYCSLTRVSENQLLAAQHCVVSFKEVRATTEGPINPAPEFQPGQPYKLVIKRGPYKWTQGLVSGTFVSQSQVRGQEETATAEEISGPDVPAPSLTQDEMVSAEIVSVALHPDFGPQLRRALAGGSGNEPNIDLALVTVKWLDPPEKVKRIGIAKLGSVSPYGTQVIETGFRTGRLHTHPWVWELGYFKTAFTGAEEYAKRKTASPFDTYYLMSGDPVEYHESGSPIIVDTTCGDGLNPLEPSLVVALVASPGLDDDTARLRLDAPASSPDLPSADQWLMDNGIPFYRFDGN